MPFLVTLGTSCMEITPFPSASNSSELLAKKHIVGVFPVKIQTKQPTDTDWTYPFSKIVKVKVWMVDGDKIDIELQSVTNQPTWTADLAGQKKAVEDINAWLVMGNIPVPPPPYLIVANSSSIVTDIYGLTYIYSEGPSPASQLFKIMAAGLVPATGNITITPSANLEISTNSGGSWQSTPVVIPFVGGAINTPTVYAVRLKAGAAVNTYTESITVSDGVSNVGDYIVTVHASVTVNNNFVMVVKTDNAGVTGTNQFRIPLSVGATYNAVIDWGDGTMTSQTNGTSPTKTYAAPGTYTIKISGIFQAIEFNNDGDRLKVLDIVNWGNNAWVVLRFWGCANLVGTYNDIPNTAALVTHYAVWANCSKFIGKVAGWNVENSLSTRSFVQNCVLFNNPFTGWNPIKNEDTASMFLGATIFNQPLNFLYMNKVKNMNSMFNLASAFNQDIHLWQLPELLDANNFMANKTAASYSATRLDAIYNTWSGQILKPNVPISFGVIKYTAAGSAGKAILTGAPKNWTIIDGGI